MKVRATHRTIQRNAAATHGTHVYGQCALALMLAHACISPALSAPSQTPLFNRADTIPRPNVMLTLDDSGSMTYQYLPERPFTLNNVTVNFPNDAKVFLHPRELSRNKFSFDGGGLDSFYVTAAPLNTLTAGMQLIQKQMRSPDVNGIYYNPSITYTPWVTPDNRAYRNADPEHAWLDPAYLHPDAATPDSTNTEWVDLTKDTTHLAYWYCSTDVGAPSYNNYACSSSSMSYSPALLYLLNPGQRPDQVGNYRDINLNTIDAAAGIVYPSTADKPSKRTDCGPVGSQVTCSKVQELQNFANWFVFYRSRLLTAKGAIPEAFMSLQDNLRVGWGTIHQGITFTNGVPSTSLDGNAVYWPDGLNKGVSSKIVQQSVRNLDAGHKAALSNWMRSLATYPGTPSKDAIYEVGQYFSRGDTLGPWATDPAAGLPAKANQQLGCRRSYNILVTDGYYRESSSTVGNADGALGAPYQDGISNTLADFATNFWATDLRTDLNTVSVTPSEVNDPSLCTGRTTADCTTLTNIKNDNATWRHLTQFMIGFGVSGNIVTTDEHTNNDKLLQLSRCGSAGGICWPNTVNEIDDLWHAAINSHGEYFSVTQTDQLKTALVRALTTSSDTVSKVAGVATASTQLIDHNTKYVPEYKAVSWTGNIRALSLDSNGVASTEQWNAADRTPAAADRRIYVWDTAGGVNSRGAASEFKFDLMSARSKSLIGSTASANLVNYLRGDSDPAWITFKTRKKVSTVNPAGFVLPDFVNSPPLLVSTGTDLGYGKLPAAQGGGDLYSSYLANKNARQTSTLFIGGNGGMLHAFNTSGSATSSPKQGAEIFAFVPEASLPNLATIARPDYGSTSNYHQYFVDGQLIETDAYFQARGQSAKQWNNVLIGAMGAGGRSVFALKLDTDNPGNLSGDSVLWESSLSNANMGYVTSTPQVGVLPDGSWKVFVGNGVDSPNHTAALIMIDLETGEAQTVSTDSTITANGLGGVALVKNSQGQVIGAYAGDFKGNLWRFEWDTSAKQMSVGYKAQPLFSAKAADGQSAQPITAAPLVASHPRLGQLVVVNTGKLLTTNDSGNTSMQSVYGIWDKVASNISTLTTAPTAITRNDLQTQSVNGAVDVTNTVTHEVNTFYRLTANAVDWAQKKGWVLDLAFAQSGTTGATVDHPKAIYAPMLVANTTALINTIRPAGNEESCQNKGAGYAIVVDITTGGKYQYMQLDANGDGRFDDSDLDFAGFNTAGGPLAQTNRNTTGGGSDPTPCPAGTYAFLDATTGKLACYRNPPSPSVIKDRIWRQLLNPPHP
ncbi:MAG: PilC/PilY family type IV pilus protein [Aquabacterium sp.]